MSAEYWLRCKEPFYDIETSIRRDPGDEWSTTNKRRAWKLGRGPLAVRITRPDGDEIRYAGVWADLLGRDLRTCPDAGPEGYRVVACLNIWNDLDALKETLVTWYDDVDVVYAVDGAYAGAPTAACASTDGTLEYLEGLDKVRLFQGPQNGFWADQVTKRNVYMEALEPGDLCFIVDADEFVTGADCLRHLPRLDVGWVVYRKGLYVKAQNFPRLYDARVGARYGGRHYWVEWQGGRVTDCQIGGAGLDHTFVPLTIDNTQGPQIRTAEQRRDNRIVRQAQGLRESKVGTAQQGGREALRIVHLTHLDPGLVVFRLHSAINSTTPHTSVMAAHMRGRVDYGGPRQYDPRKDRDELRRAVATCDVVHCHMDYQLLDTLGTRFDAPVVMHHHGTMYREYAQARNNRDERRATVRLVSNPELLKYGEDLHYLPNPVPVTRYARLRERMYQRQDGWLRVGHSPSKRDFKGTEKFLAVVENLQAEGVRITPVLMEDMRHDDVLQTKAAHCDAFFDSFWLGMQCSGLEAAAMGIPVIAGDPDVRAYHKEDPPYVYANDALELEAQLRSFMQLHENGELGLFGDRVQWYVSTYHDYAAVTAQYLDILDEHTDWRRRLTVGTPGGSYLTATA